MFNNKNLDDIMFPAPEASYSKLTSGYINIGCGRTIAAFGVHLRTAKRIVVYCHGNGEDVYDVAGFMERFLPQSVGLVVAAYSGYGLTDGTSVLNCK